MKKRVNQAQKSTAEQLLVSLLFVFAAFLISALSPQYISPDTDDGDRLVETAVQETTSMHATDTRVARLIRQVPSAPTN